MPVYYGRGTPIEPGAFPAILAVGDSWFWYPLPTGYNLLQQLADRVLKPAYDDDARRVHLVDSRGCLDVDSDWDNELHPNSKGFEKLAVGPWRAALAKYGFA